MQDKKEMRKEQQGKKVPAAKYEKATGTKVSSRGQAFAKARKEGRDSFTFERKKL